MVIVDSTVWIAYLAGDTNPETIWLEHQLGKQPLALTDLNLCEVLQGIRGDTAFARVRRQLSNFELFDTGGERLAVASARNYRVLRARGVTVRKTIDCLIATFCINRRHSLLHHDRDFDPFEKYLGLQVVHPSASR